MHSIILMTSGTRLQLHAVETTGLYFIVDVPHSTILTHGTDIESLLSELDVL